MGRKSKAFSQTMVLSCQRPNGQSRHHLIAYKTPASARSSTKFSRTLKNRGEKSSITLWLLIEVCTSSEMEADRIVKPSRSAGWQRKTIRMWEDYSELSVWESLGATWPLIWWNILSVSHGHIKVTLPAVPIAKMPLTCLTFSSRLSASKKQSQVKYKCDTVVYCEMGYEYRWLFLAQITSVGGTETHFGYHTASKLATHHLNWKHFVCGAGSVWVGFKSACFFYIHGLQKVFEHWSAVV